jgi:hypothetical protein
MINKFLPNGLRSINVQVEQSELEEARELVRMLQLQTTEKTKALIAAEKEESAARAKLARINSAIRRSGMVKP